ncbi:TPA: hypothetical protein QDB16_004472 [Burkholderia vietnamiensis]|uniref:hypothetical protein n=1 Tax=Burkholderia vietnamiensis TaxID=60552 RepID=UPI001B96FBD0|nr:hypothetical protein [Burkholderia vietnamiensis]MBR8219654.1 hypothetical protein [Burkholderia vietnamiensis]HDR9317928.1 hypothetical protein [Burkholderia vietnamiensis]HDR9355957.1 hypothetical protein [Burkholderia vietnamiensis]
MTTLTTNSHLALMYGQASAFLNLDQAARAQSDWFKSFRDDKDVRSFFKKKAVLAKGLSLQVTVISQIARAIVDCIEDGEPDLAPTGSEVRDIMKSATDLATKLTAAPTSWLTPDARTRGFQEPLRKLQTMPSIVPARTAGRLPMTQRRTFILRLAHAICEACDEIPIRLITAAVARAWEETTERQVYDVLTADERDSIRALVEAKRRNQADSENTAFLAVRRASIPRNRTSPMPETRTDAQRLAQALDIVGGFADETAAIVLHDALSTAAAELGIEPDSAEQ